MVSWFGWNNRNDAEIAMVDVPQIGALNLDCVVVVVMDLIDLDFELEFVVDVVVYLDLVDHAMVVLLVC